MIPWYVTLDTWFHNHKTLIRDLVLGLSLILAGKYGYEKWLNHEIDVDKVKAAQTQQALDQQKAKDDQLTAVITQQAASTQAAIQQYQAMVTGLMAQNAKLASDIGLRNNQLKTQQAQDANLDTAGVASRLATVENLPLTAVDVVGENLSLTSPAAHQVLQDLESVPVLKENVKDLQVIIVNKDDQIAGLQDIKGRQDDQITTLKDQVVTKTAEVVAAVEDTKAQVKLQAAKDRKSRWNWFKAGVIVGIVGGVLGAHAAGI